MVKDTGDPPAPLMRKAIPYREVVDLSRVVHPSMPRWPGDPPVRFRIDAYPAESLVAPAAVIDVRASAKADADYALDAGTVLRCWRCMVDPIRRSSARVKPWSY